VVIKSRLCSIISYKIILFRYRFFYIKSRMGWAGHIAHMGEKRNAYKILVGKSKGMRPLVRQRHWWEHNIKLERQDKVGRDWIDWASGGPL
jgi:hypothetical protein